MPLSPDSSTLIPTMPEMGEDAHVLAAALYAKADVIVTGNVKDFPPHVAPRFEIAVKTADEFLVQQWWLEPRLVAASQEFRDEPTGR